MKIYQTERLFARHWTVDDINFAVKLWGDPDVMQFIDLHGGLNQEQIAERLQSEIDRQNTFGVQYWPLFEKVTKQFIGCCGLRPWTHTPNEKNFELGFHIIKEHWGKGFAIEAAKGSIGYAQKIGLTKLYAGHHPKNDASRKILLKLGFKHLEDVFYEPTGLYHPSYVLEISCQNSMA